MSSEKLVTGEVGKMAEYQILETEFRVKKKISLLLHQAKGNTPGFCLEKLCPNPRELDVGVL